MRLRIARRVISGQGQNISAIVDQIKADIEVKQTMNAKFVAAAAGTNAKFVAELPEQITACVAKAG